MKVIGLDVGEKRIGVARADSSTRIAVPVGTILADGAEWTVLEKLAKQIGTSFFVVGLPRNNAGVETKQSLYARSFARQLIEHLPGAKVRMQDETLTSVVAEDRLRKRGKSYTKGDIDAEAAAIILQDFIEKYTRETPPSEPAPADEVAVDKEEARRQKETSTPPIENDLITNADGTVLTVEQAPKGAFADVNLLAKTKAKKKAEQAKMRARKAKNKMKTLTKAILCAIMGVLIVGGSAFAIIYLKNRDERRRQAEEAAQNAIALTYNFTIRPGESIATIKDHLLMVKGNAEDKSGQPLYSAEQINAAFSTDYSNEFSFLAGWPEGTTNLEGFLYPETINFYETDSVETVIRKFLGEMGKVIEENNLVALYAERGLTLYQGVTLASIVQLEASTPEMPTVAQVFLNRLKIGMTLGSDVTVGYALDIIDPTRATYTDNESALKVDSCYNTRLYAGLPCGPISNPGLSALLAVANPSDTSYLYFLTDESGVMYYSYTEAEHIRNIYNHCGEACQTAL